MNNPETENFHERVEGINVSNATRLAEEAKRVIAHNRECERSGISVGESGWNIVNRHIDALLALVQPAVSEEAEQRGLSLEEHFARMSPERRAAMENARPKVKAMLAEWKAARAQSSSKGDEGMQHE
jgi:hypothetical protein